MRAPTTRALAGASLAAVMIATIGCVDSGPPLPGEGDDAGRIVVYRDTWGVPHIYAPTVEDGLYAQGWAQAQASWGPLVQGHLTLYEKRNSQGFFSWAGSRPESLALEPPGGLISGFALYPSGHSPGIFCLLKVPRGLYQ